MPSPEQNREFIERVKANAANVYPDDDAAKMFAELQKLKAAAGVGASSSSRPQDIFRASWQHSYKDVREAIRTKIGLENGLFFAGGGHPSYRACGLDQAKVEDLLPVLADAKAGKEGAHQDRRVMMSITRSDLPAIIAELGSVKAQAVFAAGLDAIAWAETVNVPDLRPIPYSQGIASDLKRIPESGDFPDLGGNASVSGIPIRADLFGGILAADGSMAINDSTGVFLSLVASQAQGSARMVRKMVFGVLNANPNLPDGVAMFDATRGNIAPLPGLSAESVSAAISTLAKLKAVDNPNGDVLDLPARYLIVHTDMLLSARVICAAIATPDSMPLIPIGSAFLDAGFWYLTPSPETASCVVRAKLSGNEITVDAGKDFNKPTAGMLFRFTLTSGAFAVSPYAVRGAVA